MMNFGRYRHLLRPSVDVWGARQNFYPRSWSRGGKAPTPGLPRGVAEGQSRQRRVWSMIEVYDNREVPSAPRRYNLPGRTWREGSFGRHTLTRWEENAPFLSTPGYIYPYLDTVPAPTRTLVRQLMPASSFPQSAVGFSRPAPSRSLFQPLCGLFIHRSILFLNQYIGTVY